MDDTNRTKGDRGYKELRTKRLFLVLSVLIVLRMEARRLRVESAFHYYFLGGGFVPPANFNQQYHVCQKEGTHVRTSITVRGCGIIHFIGKFPEPAVWPLVAASMFQFMGTGGKSKTLEALIERFSPGGRGSIVIELGSDRPLTQLVGRRTRLPTLNLVYPLSFAAPELWKQHENDEQIYRLNSPLIYSAILCPKDVELKPTTRFQSTVTYQMELRFRSLVDKCRLTAESLLGTVSLQKPQINRVESGLKRALFFYILNSVIYYIGSGAANNLPLFIPSPLGRNIKERRANVKILETLSVYTGLGVRNDMGGDDPSVFPPLLEGMITISDQKEAEDQKMIPRLPILNWLQEIKLILRWLIQRRDLSKVSDEESIRMQEVAMDNVWFKNLEEDMLIQGQETLERLNIFLSTVSPESISVGSEGCRSWMTERFGELLLPRTAIGDELQDDFGYDSTWERLLLANNFQFWKEKMFFHVPADHFKGELLNRVLPEEQRDLFASASVNFKFGSVLLAPQLRLARWAQTETNDVCSPFSLFTETIYGGTAYRSMFLTAGSVVKCIACSLIDADARFATSLSSAKRVMAKLRIIGFVSYPLFAWRTPPSFTPPKRFSNFTFTSLAMEALKLVASASESPLSEEDLPGLATKIKNFVEENRKELAEIADNDAQYFREQQFILHFGLYSSCIKEEYEPFILEFFNSCLGNWPTPVSNTVLECYEENNKLDDHGINNEKFDRITIDKWKKLVATARNALEDELRKAEMSEMLREDARRAAAVRHPKDRLDKRQRDDA